MAEKEKYSSYNKIAKSDGDEDTSSPGNNHAGRDALVTWVLKNVEEWEQWRDQNFKELWNEYYRLWRGIWVTEDKTRESERSRLINPSLQQAVESAVAEQEEATFGKEAWFDVSDDIADAQREDMTKVRDYLLEDFKVHGVNAAISEIYLNGALYGTGIGKVVVEKFERKNVVSRQEGQDVIDGVQITDEIVVKLEPVSPDNFVIDTAVTRQGKEGIDQALGCACIHTVPRHTIEAKQNDESGEGDETLPSTYYKGTIGSRTINSDQAGKGEPSKSPEDSGVEVIEYYGKVPRQLLEASNKESSDSDVDMGDVDEADLVETYITIANRSFLLRGYENPNIMKDRPIVAYAFDVVPNRFWGRGIAEKAYNPQKALDGILRAQMDGLALTVHPMMAADATRLPRGMQLAVKPGKMLLTNGNPSEILKEFRFGSIDPMSYNATGDLERMIQMATGSMDSASPLKTNRRNETASGMSMIMGGTLKRAKRTLQNIERNFLEPLINKSLWRYMQFLPEKYQPMDYYFTVRGTLGLMAREVEQRQFIELLSYVPPETPAFFMLLKGIINTSSIENKQEIMGVIDQMLQPQEPDPMQAEMAAREVERKGLENQEIQSRIVRNYEKVKTDKNKSSMDRVGMKVKTLQALRSANKIVNGEKK